MKGNNFKLMLNFSLHSFRLFFFLVNKTRRTQDFPISKNEKKKQELDNKPKEIQSQH